MDHRSHTEALSRFTGKPPALWGLPFSATRWCEPKDSGEQAQGALMMRYRVGSRHFNAPHTTSTDSDVFSFWDTSTALFSSSSTALVVPRSQEGVDTLSVVLAPLPRCQSARSVRGRGHADSDSRVIRLCSVYQVVGSHTALEKAITPPTRPQLYEQRRQDQPHRVH